MGNRAIITARGAHVGIYLHWNGGRDSVEAFLKYADLAQLPGLDEHGRGLVPLTTIVANFFGNRGHSVDIVNIATPAAASPGDNGVYIVEGHTITGRIDAPRWEQDTYPLVDMLREIDAAQPERDQLGDMLAAEERATDTVRTAH